MNKGFKSKIKTLKFKLIIMKSEEFLNIKIFDITILEMLNNFRKAFEYMNLVVKLLTVKFAQTFI